MKKEGVCVYIEQRLHATLCDNIVCNSSHARDCYSEHNYVLSVFEIINLKRIYTVQLC